MGLLESAVVVYLRELYYPEGFNFPLTIMSGTIAITEILREAATLIMLVSVGIIAGRTNTEKFGYFIYSFAIWDIFYYVFLKLLLNWPESFLTWDILFLIPTTWVGPVITPILLSFAMIVLALAIINFTNKNLQTHINKLEWGLLISGSIICIASFTYEYTEFLLQKFSIIEIFTPNQELMDYAIQFIPQKFPWPIFLTGFIVIVSAIALFVYRNVKYLQNK
ncbi:MAG: hypothetical protein JEZ09_18500 [Salinivirgaceae bacterium]|nr:hypothetical protein [Salinivirgaceae bacterium]